MSNTIDILSAHEEDLRAFFFERGYQDFRLRQLLQWLYTRHVYAFDHMHTLPAKLREELKESFHFNNLQQIKEHRSPDGTRKILFATHDNHYVEGVLIPNTTGRYTACLSSQIGCSLNCAFCATAGIPFGRNLTAGEILQQAVLLQQAAHTETKHNSDIATKTRTQSNQSSIPLISNIVYMGMGEPLANYDSVVQSIRLLIDKMHFPARRITLSTAGLSKRIMQLADEQLGIQLAVSLHSAQQDTRLSIMNVAQSNPLPSLIPAMQYWQQKTGNLLTLEYLLLDGVNDSPQHLTSLSQLAAKLRCKINIIEFNPVTGIELKGSNESVINTFAAKLTANGIRLTVRRSGGGDIAAACGQLAARNTAQK